METAHGNLGIDFLEHYLEQKKEEEEKKMALIFPKIFTEKAPVALSRPETPISLALPGFPGHLEKQLHDLSTFSKLKVLIKEDNGCLKQGPIFVVNNRYSCDSQRLPKKLLQICIT